MQQMLAPESNASCGSPAIRLLQVNEHSAAAARNGRILVMVNHDQQVVDEIIPPEPLVAAIKRQVNPLVVIA